MQNTTETTLVCKTCGKSFQSEKSARGHANKTGHTRDWDIVPTTAKEDVVMLAEEIDAAFTAAKESATEQLTEQLTELDDPDALLDAAIDDALGELEDLPITRATCLCGCGAPVVRTFCQGHDARLKGQMKKSLKAGEGLDSYTAEQVGYAREKWAHLLGI